MSSHDEQDTPLDAIGASERLQARVVDARAAPRIHGYGVDDDLARHYSLGEVSLLALTGQAPSSALGRAFESASIFMAPISVAEAPAHAARLGRTVNASASGCVAVAATALAEQARWLLEQHAELLAWLDGARDGFPDSARCDAEAERERVDALRELVRDDVGELAAFDHDPGLWPAVLAVCHACGLREAEHLIAAIVQSRLSVAVAEATAAPGPLTEYPINVPPIHYAHEREDQ